MAVVVDPVMGAGPIGQNRDEEALGVFTFAADVTAVRVGLGLVKVRRGFCGFCGWLG